MSVLAEFSKWLAATPLSHTIQTTSWMIPAIQTLHILGVAILFSSAVLVDLRVLRLLQRDVPMPEVTRRFLPVVWPIVLVLLITGSLLIIGEPRRSLLNSTFYIKMALLALALLLTAGLQRFFVSPAAERDAERGRRIGAGVVASASLLVWCSILVAGRWIAYTQAG